MKSFWSVILVVAIFLSFQSNALADNASHKQLVTKATSALKDTAKNKAVNKSQWYPSFHFAPQAGWMNDPNGLIFFNGEYHIFYQHNPYSAKHENMHWGHAASPDMVNWRYLPVALAPSEDYDKNGVFSGSAIVHDGILSLLYTGNVENKVNDKVEKHQTQNLAISKDGINFGKSANNPVIKMAPHYSSYVFSRADFRDPFVWMQDEHYYALIGTQYEKTKDGAVLLFKSKDLRNWVFINITAIGSKGEMGYMWECPNFTHLGAEDVLMISPQGIKPNGKQFLNKYQAGWFVGKLDYNSGRFKQSSPFGLFDYGFDFYAPQVMKTPDGRSVIIGWLDMWDTKMPEQSHGWAGMMSLPREMKIVNGRVVTLPVAELKALRTDVECLRNIAFKGAKSFNNVKGEVYEMELQADLAKASKFELKLRASQHQETLLVYDKTAGVLKLNRDKSGQGLTGEREVKLPLVNNKLKLHIFVDKSSIEVFAQDGKAVMSSRIYPDKTSQAVHFVSDNDMVLDYLNFYKLKSIHN